MMTEGTFDVEGSIPGRVVVRRVPDIIDVPPGVSDEIDLILAGWVVVEGFQPVRVGEYIDWAQDPYGHPSWVAGFHNFEWLRVLVDHADACASYRQRARDIMRSWMSANPIDTPASTFSWQNRTTGLRARTFAAAALFAREGWYQQALQVHGDHLADPGHYAGPWNHGLDQDLGLLEVAHAADNEVWMDVVEDRIQDMYAIAVDEQGVSHEQATVYHDYNRFLFGQLVEVLARCGRQVPPWFAARLAKMPEYLAHATSPTGRWAQIGDMYEVSAEPGISPEVDYARTQGAEGTAPAETVKVYDAGYIFGRTGWGTARPFAQESCYILRFGPPRAYHGHHDKTSLLWWWKGHPVLVDAGFAGYEAGKHLSYVRSARAHNACVSTNYAGWPVNPTTNLTKADVTDTLHDFAVEDRPYDGVYRTRRVAFDPVAETMRVWDLLEGDINRTFSQWWHLPEGFAATVAGQVVTATNGQINVRISQADPVAQMRVHEGSTDPYQGWVSPGFEQIRPAPAIEVVSQPSKQVTFDTTITATLI